MGSYFWHLPRDEQVRRESCSKGGLAGRWEDESIVRAEKHKGDGTLQLGYREIALKEFLLLSYPISNIVLRGSAHEEAQERIKAVPYKFIRTKHLG